MSELTAILQQANVRRALVVDDAYDHMPLASDLAVDADEWTHFFEDLADPDGAVVRRIYPAFDGVRADVLQASNEFVAALWNHRGELSGELIQPLFARYAADTATDQAHLATLVDRLRESGLDCDTAGREFQRKAADVDLIVIDLYLGSTQDDADITTSIDGLTEVISARRTRPPLVVLMSRSTRLEEKRAVFRDRTGLFESAFRIIRKAELAEPGKLQRILMRLSRHYSDSLKLAAFVTAWEKGLDGATKRTASLIRTLDLPDHAQIRELLLNAEGEPTGSYLVDVFDRVLQHETEREAAIIDAAIALNSLTSDAYPPPYVAGSPDLQDLVHRSLFQNRQRLRLPGSEGSRVAFGDILRRKALQASGEAIPASASAAPLKDTTVDDVLAVLTPACDLQRTAAKRVLLLVGTLRPLVPADWTYRDDPTRTPVFEMPDGQRFWIRWDVKHIETLSHDDLQRALLDRNGFEIVARLRESHALELQQKLLSNLGRIGLTAPMPATFAMRVEAYLPAPDKKPFQIDVPGLAQSGGVCYVGRQGETDMRLVLCEDACDAICSAIESVDLTRVHANAHEAIAYLRTSGELLQALEQGVSLPSPGAQTFKEIASPTRAMKEGPNPRPRIIGLITRNRDISGLTLSNADVQKAGIILGTWDDDVGAREAEGNRTDRTI